MKEVKTLGKSIQRIFLLLPIAVGCLIVMLENTKLVYSAGEEVTTDAGTIDVKQAAKPFKSKESYSPYAGWNYPMRVYWGDTHLHTAASMDAGAFGCRLTPREAYRFAKGEDITASSGQLVKLSRPLDFLVVADHSDNMGFFPDLFAGKSSVLADPAGRRWYDMIKSGKGADAGADAVGVVEIS